MKKTTRTEIYENVKQQQLKIINDAISNRVKTIKAREIQDKEMLDDIVDTIISTIKDKNTNCIDYYPNANLSDSKFYYTSDNNAIVIRNYLKKLEIFKDLCIDVMSSINTYVISWTLEYDAYDIAFLENINSVLNQIDYCNSVSILANNIEYNQDEAQKLEQYLNENYKDILKLTFKTSLFTDTKSSPSSHYFKVEWNKIEGE
jgi:hypothetical protein